MAVSVIKESKDLMLTFIREVQQDKILYETRRMRNFKTDAQEADIYAVASAIVALSEQPSTGIRIQEISTLETL